MDNMKARAPLLFLVEPLKFVSVCAISNSSSMRLVPIEVESHLEMLQFLNVCMALLILGA